MPPSEDLEPRVRTVEGGLVRLETTVTLFVQQATRLIPKLEELLEERSGEQAEAEVCRRDIDRAHEKIRAMEARQDREQEAVKERLTRVENRQNKLFWMAVGGLAVLQSLAAAANWLIEHRQLLGGG